jgi:dTDP-4-dehydrorhamnose reductase
MRKLFITGESGMLATSIISALKEDSQERFEIMDNSDLAEYTNEFSYLNGELVKAKEVDITDVDVLYKIAAKLTKDDIIIHTAAYVNTDKCDDFSYDAINSNIVGTQNLINIANTVGCKIIYFSTTAVFDPDEYMKNNGEFDESSKINPKTLYGLSKYSGELAVKQSVDFERMIVIKPVFIYGDAPFDNSSMIRKITEKVYCDKNDIPYTLSPLNKNGRLDVLLDPTIEKDYMRYEYFADMFLQILLMDNGWGKDFIISKDRPMKFENYLSLIREVTGCNDLSKHIEIKAKGDYLARHNGKSKNFYDLYQHYNLSVNAMNSREGITKTYMSIVKHYGKTNRKDTTFIKQARLFHI